MDLQYLSGVDSESVLQGETRDLDLAGAGNGMDELGKVIRRNMAAMKKRLVPVKASATPPMKRTIPAVIPIKRRPCHALCKH